MNTHNNHADTIDIEALVRVVAAARQQTTQAEATLKTARSAWEQDHAALFTIVEAARAAQEVAEAALREAVLAVFTQEGNKHPHPATGVRVTSRLIYDPHAITEWAREHLPAVLVLDVKTFERVAPHLMVPGVSTVEEPTATIAQDLAGWLTA
jgi:hypothetical protein